MSQFTTTKADGTESIWVYDDAKLDFNAWVNSSKEITDKWLAASMESSDWITAHPGEIRTEMSPAGAMFMEWADYASAVKN